MAGPTKLELRDVEMLRALLRVRYLTSRQLNAAFFSCPRVGRRRIHRLSEYDLIREHAKGLPEALGYRVWRLTARGLDAVAHAFPDEPIPDCVLDRVATGRLHHVFHREALAELYLRLTVPELTDMSERDLAAHRRWVTALRRRASSISWQPDGDVVLAVDSLGQRTEVVPDAVVRSPVLKRRVFIELDRSTKNLGRIRDCLHRYVTVLGQVELAGDARTVLFVVRSAARRRNIERLTELLPLVVLEEADASYWLREHLLAPDTRPRTNADSMPTAARRAYSWITKLEAVLQARGMHALLWEAEPALMQEGHERLVALHRLLTAQASQAVTP
jgi:hypothetical protein